MQRVDIARLCALLALPLLMPFARASVSPLEEIDIPRQYAEAVQPPRLSELPSSAATATSSILTVMGSNEYGALGLGETASLTVPSFVAARVVDVCTARGDGGGVMYFLRSDGGLYGYGANSKGQTQSFMLGGAYGYSIDAQVKLMAGGGNFLIYVTIDGKLKGLGSNAYCALGLPDTPNTTYYTPVEVSSGVDATALAAGLSHTLLLQSDGKVLGMGDNSQGQLGQGETATLSQPTQIATDCAAIAAAGSTSFLLKKDGTLWVSGSSTDGQLGLGSTTRQTTFVQLASDVLAVRASERSALFIRKDSTLWGMGYNGSGHLDAARINLTVPTQLASDVIDAAQSSGHLLMVTSAGTCQSRGINFNGQLANGTTRTPSSMPTKPCATNLAKVKKVAASDGVSFFLTPEGHLYAAGSGEERMFGRTVIPSSPNPVTLTNDPVAFAAGSHFSLFLDATGALHGLGGNTYGQLGVSTLEPQTAAVVVATEVASMAAGVGTSYYVKTNGNLYGLGHNVYGQLNTGNTVGSFMHRLIDSDVKAVFKTHYTTLYLKTDNTLWGLGRNRQGNLDGTGTASQMTPVQVASNVAFAVGGLDHVLFVKNDNTLWGVGSDSIGQLGLGSHLARNAPTQIDSGVVAIAAGNYHSLFLKTDGSLWGMGSNSLRQLGLASTSSPAYTPAPITTGVASISASHNSSLWVKTDGSVYACGANQTCNLGVSPATTAQALKHVRAHGIDAEISDTHSLVTCLPQVATSPINRPPTVGAITEQGAFLGGETRIGPAIADPDSSALFVRVRSADETLIPRQNIMLQGYQGTEAIRFVPAAGKVGTTQLTLSVSDGFNTVETTFDVTVTDSPALANISARAHVADADNILVPGFVISGLPNSYKTVLVRAVGLRLADFGLPEGELLRDPILEVRRSESDGSSTYMNGNDNWADNSTLVRNYGLQAGAFPLDGRPRGTNDGLSAAVVVPLPPGNYTVQVRGYDGGAGVALAEVYDVGGTGSRLVNVSNRGFVGLGNKVMVPGIVVAGERSRTFLVRAVGPGLAKWLPKETLLANPRLTLNRIEDGVPSVVGSNDDWSDTANSPETVEATADKVRAFALEAGSKDAAMVVTLPPGLYTATCEGANDGTGIAIVEVYEVQD